VKNRKAELKDVEFRLISELMKNSRRSDRELSNQMRVSQPTVSRLRKRLEKEGYVKEYTMIPDWQKIGYQLMAFTLVKLKGSSTEKDMGESRLATLIDSHRKAPEEIVFFQRGLGESYTGILISFHKSYVEYLKLQNQMKEHPFIDNSCFTSFLVDMNDGVHYRSLTLSTLANHLLTTLKE
jgi:DNA-binding Lrp family transcriptional regulator